MVRVPLGEVLMMTSFCTLIVLPTSDSSKSLKNRSYFSRLVCNNGGWLFFRIVVPHTCHLVLGSLQVFQFSSFF